MIWRNLNLRMRILLGYGLILALATALALILVLRVGALNSQIQQLNATVTLEASTGAGLAAKVDEAQHAVERYLQDPRPDHYQMAYGALQSLTAELERARASLAGTTQ